jgi:hypothetical protein
MGLRKTFSAHYEFRVSTRVDSGRRHVWTATIGPETGHYRLIRHEHITSESSAAASTEIARFPFLVFMHLAATVKLECGRESDAPRSTSQQALRNSAD